MTDTSDPEAGPQFVEFRINVPAILRVDITDPYWHGGVKGVPEKLAQYLCAEFVTATFDDNDAAFVGQSEIALDPNNPVEIVGRITPMGGTFNGVWMYADNDDGTVNVSSPDGTFIGTYADRRTAVAVLVRKVLDDE
jgi:hypothetical protein